MKYKYKNQGVGICPHIGGPILMQWLPATKKWECIHGDSPQEDKNIIDKFLLKVDARNSGLFCEQEYFEDSAAEEMIQNQLDNY